MEVSAWLGVGFMILFVLAVRGAESTRELRRWLGITTLFVVWALGPFLSVMGGNTGILLPQALARAVPIINNARMPGRAMAMVVLGALVVLALALSQRPRTSRRSNVGALTVRRGDRRVACRAVAMGASTAGGCVRRHRTRSPARRRADRAIWCPRRLWRSGPPRARLAARPDRSSSSAGWGIPRAATATGLVVVRADRAVSHPPGPVGWRRDRRASIMRRGDSRTPRSVGGFRRALSGGCIGGSQRLRRPAAAAAGFARRSARPPGGERYSTTTLRSRRAMTTPCA